MNTDLLEFDRSKAILRLKGRMCATADDLLAAPAFRQVLERFVDGLGRRQSRLLDVFGTRTPGPADLDVLARTVQFLAKIEADYVARVIPGSDVLLRDRPLLRDFLEELYDFWRVFDRFIVYEAPTRSGDVRPHRIFNETIEQLTHLVRDTYRDVLENLTGRHPRVYRNVTAGAEIAAIARPLDVPCLQGPCAGLAGMPVIRQVLLYPPLILNPPMNKRDGMFERIATNPLERMALDPSQWLVYPAKVGPLLVLAAIHQSFLSLGFSLANLFEIADEEDLRRSPDAVLLYGVPDGSLDGLGASQTVFYEDPSGLLIGAIPARDEFGYFGYLKKMMLTLHNVRRMRDGRMPFHGAFVRVITRGDRERNVLLMGDTGAGKSETLEALQDLGSDLIQDVVVIADDMGSLDVAPDGSVVGYGTEIGAFLRLDDLKPGYAFGRLDRAILMSATQVNARIILPVTTFETVVRGHRVDIVLYANNHEAVDDDHPVIERFGSPDEAFPVFRAGRVMSKGTTKTTGLVGTYFANVFGPAQYPDLHDVIARRHFQAMFDAGVWVGQMRTRLGLPGWERTGPAASARRLLELIRGEV